MIYKNTHIPFTSQYARTTFSQQLIFWTKCQHMLDFHIWNTLNKFILNFQKLCSYCSNHSSVGQVPRLMAWSRMSVGTFQPVIAECYAAWTAELLLAAIFYYAIPSIRLIDQSDWLMSVKSYLEIIIFIEAVWDHLVRERNKGTA